jgi:hypothetical protein
MLRVPYFERSDLATVQETALQAEDLSFRHFGLTNTFTHNLAYEYRTLADLRNHEIIDHSFAQLVRYRLRPHKSSYHPSSNDLYSICLQDHRILDVIKNRKDGVLLKPLMLYIMTHEMIHIIRFSTLNQDFDASSYVKEEEEKNVHTITYKILRQLEDPGVCCVLDHYSPFRNPGVNIMQ